MSELTTKSEGQKGTSYEPNRVARKLLEILLNPEHRFKSVQEVCDLANIDRKTYYRLFHNKDFVCHYTRESQKLVKAAQGPIVNASIKSAIRGNPQHTKILLTMAGMYQEKTGLIINPDANGNPQPIQLKSDMELAVKVARLAHLLFNNPQVMALIQEQNGDTTTQRAVDNGPDAIDVGPEPGNES